MHKQLVVSHYEQNLAWAQQVGEIVPTVIYDKSGKQSEYITLDNVGREPHTYMHHIVENYSNLAEWTIFAQDNPFEHVHNWIDIVLGDEDTWYQLATHRQKKGYFFSNMGLLTSDQTGAPHHRGLPIAELWSSMFQEDCPKYVDFAPSCHFVVHRDVVVSRPVNFYSNVKDILAINHISPWALERYISYIFNPAYN